MKTAEPHIYFKRNCGQENIYRPDIHRIRKGLDLILNDYKQYGEPLRKDVTKIYEILLRIYVSSNFKP